MTNEVLNVTKLYKFTIPPATVDELQIDAYTGRWFQMYASLIPNITFEKDGVCVTADYFDPITEGDEAKFTLLNSQRYICMEVISTRTKN